MVTFNTRARNLLKRSLVESLNHDLLGRVAQRVVPQYDIYERTGIPENIPIQIADAAEQVVRDMNESGLVARFVEALVDIEDHGFMGRQYTIRNLDDLIDAIENQGYYYDERFGIFMEGDDIPKTPGWGYLREGPAYEFSFLKVDIVGNSELVRTHRKRLIDRAYDDFHQLVTRVIESRTGRVWHWEGDGGLTAFHFGDKNVAAALSAIEILLELFLYNLRQCPLDEPLRVRVAVHTGSCPFATEMRTIQSDTLRRVEELEHNHTDPDTVSVSQGVYSDLGHKLAALFTPNGGGATGKIYRYGLSWSDR